jgi:hypothetical protein
MKRSAQVALVLMGVTGTTAAGAYMMPPRPQCEQAPASAPGAAPPALTSDPKMGAAQPCRRRNWGPWRWSSNSHSQYSYSPNNTNWSSPRSWFPSTRSSPTSTSIAPTTSGPRSSGPSAPSTPRSGFGTTGHSISHGPGS